MLLQTIITAVLCVLIVSGTVATFKKVYPETKGTERGVFVVVCCLLILAMLYLLCRAVWKN